MPSLLKAKYSITHTEWEYTRKRHHPGLINHMAFRMSEVLGSDPVCERVVAEGDRTDFHWRARPRKPRKR